MNRKNFLQTFLTVSAGVALAKAVNAAPNRPVEPFTDGLIPPFLKQGDTIGITCPAGPVEKDKLDQLVKASEKWGINFKLGKTVGKRWQRYGGTDEERLEDLQQMLDDENIHAIVFGRGGYGTMRIIDKVNWDAFKRKPKWLIGFSDLTTIHSHIHNNMGIATIHGCMSTSISDDDNNIASASLSDALFGFPISYTINGYNLNRAGVCSGKLVGGNLSILQACAGSQSDIDTKGKILLIEDVSEYKYTIDRMLTYLKRSGKLQSLAGLIVGSFSATKEDDDYFYDDTIENIIFEKVKEYDYPVCFNFPVGHIKNNRAVKLGIDYTLSVTKDSAALKELAYKTNPKEIQKIYNEKIIF